MNTSTPVVSYSTSLDISKFINYGHKIIWYHGFSDPGPPVLGTIKYYNAMANRYGGFRRPRASPGCIRCRTWITAPAEPRPISSTCSPR